MNEESSTDAAPHLIDRSVTFSHFRTASSLKAHLWFQEVKALKDFLLLEEEGADSFLILSPEFEIFSR